MDSLLQSTSNDCLSKLLLAGKNISHPFRTGVSAMRDVTGINMRTVILHWADMERNSVCFYTDIRSPKVTDLRKDDNIRWLFYDAEEKVQLRISGKIMACSMDEMAEQHWGKVSPQVIYGHARTFLRG